MPVVTSCPSCAAKFRVDEKLLGKKVRCPKCSATIALPAEGASEGIAATATPSTSLPATPAPATPAAPGAPKVVAAKPVAKPLAKASPVRPAAVPATTPPAAAMPAAPVPVETPVEPNAGIEPIVITPAVNLAGPKPVGAPSTSAPAAKPQGNQLVLIIAGVAVVALLALGGIGFAFLGGSGGKKSTVAGGNSGSGKKSNKSDKKSETKGTIVINWGAADRAGGQLTLDGMKQTIPADGEIAISATPGSHKLALRRRNYEIIQETVTVSPEQRIEFNPTWKELPSVASNNNTGNNTPAPIPGGNTDIASNPFKPGSAITVRGFEGGWQQSISDATTIAAREKKDILIVFASSDGSVKSAQLAIALANAGATGGELAQRFVPVVIDLPTTAAGRNKVLDYRANVMLANDYGIDDLDEVPVLVLADSEGKPYGVERKWEDGTKEITPIFERLARDKEERNTLLQGTRSGEQNLAAAAKMGEWIISRKLIWHYRFDFEQWYQLATKGDPQNAAGHLESLLEGAMLIRLRQVNRGDVVELTRTLSLLDPFLKTSKFNNQDRGARLHFIAGSIYMSAESPDEGQKHFEKAAQYQPTDPQLKKQMDQVKFLLANSNILGNGTGFLIADGGYILTNRHVVEGPGKVMVRLTGVKDPVSATTIHIDDTLDLALLKIELAADATAKPLPFAEAAPELSMEVAAYGFPNASNLGDALKATTGSIASLPTANTDAMLLLDLKVNPGNSGGPLIDKMGNVAGVVTAKTGTSGFQDSYGLAIPAAEVSKFLNDRLPPEAVRPKTTRADELKNWAEVTRLVQSSVVMILKVR